MFPTSTRKWGEGGIWRKPFRSGRKPADYMEAHRTLTLTLRRGRRVTALTLDLTRNSRLSRPPFLNAAS